MTVKWKKEYNVLHLLVCTLYSRIKKLYKTTEDYIPSIWFCNIFQEFVLELIIMDEKDRGTLVKIVNMQGITKAMYYIHISLR